MIRWLHSFYTALTTPPLSETESIIRVFQDNLPNDYEVFRDIRILPVLSDQITEYTKLLHVSSKLLEFSKKTPSDLIFEVRSVKLCNFYNGENTISVADKTEDFIEAARKFLTEYKAAAQKTEDNDVVNVRRFEVVYLNLKEVASMLLLEQIEREYE